MKRILITGLAMISAAILIYSCSDARASKIDVNKEKEAIRAVIALETESYYKQDFNTWKSTYVDSSYFRSYGYWEGYAEKVRTYNGFESLKNFKKKQFEENRTLWVGSIEKRTNENFRISSDIAWYTFDQASYDKKTGKFYGSSVETRILEKHNGQWKIAYLGFHYLPLKDSSPISKN